MNVQQLIEVLEKVPDKTIEVVFTYDSRCGAGDVHCVDIETYLDYDTVLALRSETTEDYDWYNYTLSYEEYEKKARAEFETSYEEEVNRYMDIFSYSREEAENSVKERLESNLDSYKKEKERMDRNYKIRNLFLEDEMIADGSELGMGEG